MADQLGRLQIIEQLRRLNSNQSTGTFFIKTTGKHLAVFIFKEGKIISLTYSHYRGLKALPEMAKITSGECTYKPMALGTEDSINPQNNIPTTREIIHQLESNPSNPLEIVPVVNQEPVNSIQASLNSIHKNIMHQTSSDISEEELLAGIADILIDYIGPISAMICDDVASDLGCITCLSDAHKLVINLSEDIGEAAHQQKFISDANTYLKQFFS